MKPDFNEDEILALLNDVTITEDELSPLEFNDIEKRNLRNKVINKVKEKSSKIRNFSKAASVILVCLIVLASTSVIAAINTKIFGDNKAIEQAVKNNYVQTVTVGTVNDNGVGIQLTNIVIDKAKFALSFDLKFDNPEILKNLQCLKMDLEIKDEKGRILWGYHGQDLSDENVLGVISSLDDDFEILDKDNGKARYHIILDSDDRNIPVLNKVDINIRAISLYRNDNLNDNADDISGKWQFSVDVNSEFKNNNSIFFTADNTDNEVTVNTVETTQTGTVIKIVCPKNVDIDVFKNVNLIDDKAASKIVTGVVGTQYDENNNAIYTVTFPISTFDNPKDLKFVIKDYNGRNVEIKLNRI
ncbi:DUF4179 domain-containing protein [Clostridium botulinum]|uniref:DUF4179 domain-containing protein n=1 Tax=Clostridium botulinum (strain Eklund 17B / Type B) TaxID=935198 RepID=B2TS10_CLOBB|nr:DUF4179 domain-containing protein [Clostridium sp. ZBS18]ACD24654.1 conserved hypothetical protein [Clostridium botulinum B str. Eklund 17B (NRP)]MBN1055725.1 DUF4179 domain-containing protein [Clostridium botulinum]MBY6975823.1 DUF4179 domain-containing protein [Clostridium botulinum]MBY7000246.1 DUF4179 domain-containing protein [Clostridium botulinum]MCR1273004.1 DUF4179 domain-containing protein [Clostridium botulinum]